LAEGRGAPNARVKERCCGSALGEERQLSRGVQVRGLSKRGVLERVG